MSDKAARLMTMLTHRGYKPKSPSYTDLRACIFDNHCEQMFAATRKGKVVSFAQLLDEAFQTDPSPPTFKENFR